MKNEFFPCPNNITSLAPRFGSAAAWVYVLLFSQADSEGRCAIKQEELAVQSGLSTMTVRRAVERLQAEGAVSIERTGRASMFILNNQSVHTEQSDTHQGTITDTIAHTEQSECSHRTISEAETEQKPKRRQAEAFSAPTYLEVSDYMEEIGTPDLTDAFMSWNESVGWKVGKHAMKDWRAACRTWKQRKEKERKESAPPAVLSGSFAERKATIHGWLTKGETL